MGKALRDLKIPVGEVLSSPTYRALATARLAQLANPQSHAELGDRGHCDTRLRRVLVVCLVRAPID